MVALETPALERGWKAPEFKLKDPDGKVYTLDDVRGEKGLVVMFICNHCPYVKAIINLIVRDMRELKENHGVGSVAIMSNDITDYPEDSPENMKMIADLYGFPFPYLIDDTQEIAKAYGAVCTPDFFGFNRDLELQYRGRLDESRVEHVPGAERELFGAMAKTAREGVGPDQQIPSMGCSIKWKDEAA